MVFKSIEEAYLKKAKGMANYALRKLYRKEDATDVVHDAFVKAQTYKNKNPKSVVSSFILDRSVAFTNIQFAIATSRCDVRCQRQRWIS